ncbi:MAG: hypothetical protein NHB14_20830 [Desulfosporosinus sp.]|nr:hypothetical protein [Desulfosporosinus sp.]
MNLPKSFKIGSMPYVVLKGEKYTAQLEGADLHADVNIGAMEFMVNTKSVEQRQRQGLFISIIRAAFMEAGIIQKKAEREDEIARLGYALLQFILDNPLYWLTTELAPPSVFNIGCTVYTLDMSEDAKAYLDGAGLWGLARYNDCKILLDPEIAPPKRQETLLHEIIHAILNTYFMDNNEEIVYRLTPVLFQLLRENDFAWIREVGEETDEPQPKNMAGTI